MTSIISSVQKVEILPSNQPSGGVYSYREGNPIVDFQIGKRSALLRSSTLRINGKIEIVKNDGSPIDNGDLKGTGLHEVILAKTLLEKEVILKSDIIELIGERPFAEEGPLIDPEHHED